MLQNAGPFAANRTTLVGGSQRDSFATTSSLLQDTDVRVISALKFLISGGYVSRLDIFEAVRDWRTDLDVALRGVEPKQKGCA